MKVLTAEEFAEKVMENGTEIEADEAENFNREDGDDVVWTVYAHIDSNGNLVRTVSDAEWTITANLELSEEQSEALMNGELDDVEKKLVIEELYPQYIDTLKENEDWINL